jgi:hypothetical protein
VIHDGGPLVVALCHHVDPTTAAAIGPSTQAEVRRPRLHQKSVSQLARVLLGMADEFSYCTCPFRTRGVD